MLYTSLILNLKLYKCSLWYNNQKTRILIKEKNHYNFYYKNISNLFILIFKYRIICHKIEKNWIYKLMIQIITKLFIVSPIPCYFRIKNLRLIYSKTINIGITIIYFTLISIRNIFITFSIVQAWTVYIIIHLLCHIFLI